jgi:uncharacterized membrane protein
VAEISTHFFTFGTAFLGSAVESVEALTIVLAVGLTRGWRYPLYGTVAALAVLAVIVLTLGQVITSTVPEAALKLVVGSLILLFGLRWLNKAVLRSAGLLPMHDENQAYGEALSQLSGEAEQRHDWLGFTIAFKGVFLEGVEVAFIVFAVGASNHDLAISAVGGIAAMVAVAAMGFAVRRPLAMIPENSLKFGVGVVLASLGTFWAAEGMGVSWPLDFLSILALAALYLATALVVVRLVRVAPTEAAGVAEVV